MRVPDPAHGGVAHPRVLGHGAGAPVDGLLGDAVDGLLDNALNSLLGVLPFATTARFVFELSLCHNVWGASVRIVLSLCSIDLASKENGWALHLTQRRIQENLCPQA